MAEKCEHCLKILDHLKLEDKHGCLDCFGYIYIIDDKEICIHCLMKKICDLNDENYALKEALQRQVKEQACQYVFFRTTFDSWIGQKSSF